MATGDIHFLRRNWSDILQIAREDLLWMRNYIAEKYHKEFTPQQVLEIIQRATKVEVADRPGLATLIRMRQKLEDK